MSSPARLSRTFLIDAARAVIRWRMRDLGRARRALRGAPETRERIAAIDTELVALARDLDALGRAQAGAA
jgi:hypothetical protein